MSDIDILIHALQRMTGRDTAEIREFLLTMDASFLQEIANHADLQKLDSMVAEMQGLREWFDQAKLADLPGNVNLSDLLDNWNRRN